MTIRVPCGELHNLARSLLVRAGLAGDDATVAADVACYADRHGLTTHGLGALAGMYVPWLLSGRVDAGAKPRVVAEHGAVSVIDGGNGLGAVMMTAAADRAMGAARRHGVAVVAVRNSSHFGAAGFYTHRLACAGVIGIAMTNCGAQGVVPPLGGALRLLGTNPVSAAVPAGSLPPFVLDMSTTVAATGRLKVARREDRPVPVGWLIGRDGTDVTDPSAYYDGSADLAWLGGRLATGGAKGYGLALLVDLLCGPVAGAAYGPHAKALSAAEPGDDRDVGHFAIALDPSAFGDSADIGSRTAELLGTVSACPPASYADRVSYPGALEAERAAKAEAAGVPLPSTVAKVVSALAMELDVPLPRALRPGMARRQS